MSYKDYLKQERLPTPWCPGCGDGLILRETANSFDLLGLKKEETIVVSGIGCAGRSAGFFDMDTVHGLHGRAIPLAEGIKLANEKLNVIVFSGDGDLLSIGGNHLLHGSRRNTNLTVICVNNEVYGMTGGQLAPTTRKGAYTITSPKGNVLEPISAQKLITANKDYFYARTSMFQVDHMRKCIMEAIKWKGFAFVEVISVCPANFGRRIGYKSPYDMFKFVRDTFKRKNEGELGPHDLGIMTK